jgi:DNA replication and repair protein RecF
VKVSPSDKFNLLYGPNGSGKTSFFEAIYYLMLGRSFRTRHNVRAIQHNNTHLSIFAKIRKDDELISLGIERHSGGKNLLRINQENKSSMLEATKILPVQLLNPESRHLLTAYSKARRGFIDWGVFHVEPSFILSWQQAQRALKQRNAALKSNASKTMVEIWNVELNHAAGRLNTFRKNYLAALEPILLNMLSIFFKDTFNLSFKYKAGWDEEDGLITTLQRTLSRDFQLGYTQHGPHKTDLLIRINNTIPAQDVLSQGQQKLLVYALHLAQGILLKKQSGKKCVFLLDDLSAELDVENRRKVIEALHQIDAQVFITAIDKETLESMGDFPNTCMFHVERGKIIPAV